MEKLIDLESSKHYLLLSRLINKIDKTKINKILDAGSGKTSLSTLLKLFPDTHVEAIVFYNDLRKINSIKENIVSNRYTLVEKDICKDEVSGKYDLVLAHLLLGEAIKWGNRVEDLLSKLISIESKYLIVYDLKEDTALDYDYLEQVLNKYFIILAKDEIEKEEPQAFRDFIGKTYKAYLLERK